MRGQEDTGNVAYIDNQNLYMATHFAPEPWDVDMRRFRVYLREKYGVAVAYLFMGAFEYRRQDMYARFQQYGYVLVFREHSENMKGKKKGNVDVDVVFQMMRDAYERDECRAVLVSGDGDYYRTVAHLVGMGRFAKIILPSHKSASSLYKNLGDRYRTYIDTEAARRKFGRKR